METNYQAALEQERIHGKEQHCYTDRISLLLCLALQIPQPVLRSTSPNDIEQLEEFQKQLHKKKERGLENTVEEEI